MKNKSFWDSLVNAIDGIVKSVQREKNLRFHMVVADLICIFAYFYGLDRLSWAVLILAIMLVLSAETINTAIEQAVDTATHEIKPSAKLAKDAAAGAVLLTAVGAVLIGVCLFGDIDRITYTLKIIFTNMKILIPCLINAAIDIAFLLGLKIKKK